MEAISDTLWDVVICGTGLQQSLLALALSRSDKKILHIDPDEYYGGAEASLSLQEADTWANRHGTADGQAAEAGTAASIFASASVTQPEKGEADPASTAKLGPSRAYALALAPQLLHSRCALVSQLVSSRAFRQLEFLAVSSFFVVEAAEAAAATTEISSPTPSLVRIPATREDVFATTAMASRAKRQLMKFLKFVVAQGGSEADETNETNETNKAGGQDVKAANATKAAGAGWRSQANAPFGPFLQSEFSLDKRLRDYVLALTLSLDGANTTVADGLSRLHRHFSSMGAFGPGFAAVYPKWGGCSEVAQVACRAGAVGGAVYMLGAGVRQMEKKEDETGPLLEIELTTDERVKTRLFVGSREELRTVPNLAAPEADADADTEKVSRLMAVVDAPLSFLFEPTVEGAPVAGGAVIVLPAGQAVLTDGKTLEHPIFVMAHSSDTGECPPGQCVLYLTTMHMADGQTVLEGALDTLLVVLANESSRPGDAVLPSAEPRRSCLYRLYYEQSRSRASGVVDQPSQEVPQEPQEQQEQQQEQKQEQKEQQPPPAGLVGPSPPCQDLIVLFPPLAVDLTVDDRSLDAVYEAWVRVMAGGGKRDEYMVFEDREKGDEDEYE